MQAEAEADSAVVPSDLGTDENPEGNAESDQDKALEKKRIVKQFPLTGTLDAEKLQQVLTTSGEPFNSTELEDFLKVSILFSLFLSIFYIRPFLQNLSLNDGRVDYMRLAQQLAGE